MNRVDVRIPSQIEHEVHGYLYESDDPFDLSEDMLEVAFPNGICIEAGWHPESDAAGRYRVVVVSGLEVIAGPFLAATVDEAKTLVEMLAMQFGRQVVALSKSTTMMSEVHDSARDLMLI